MPDDSGDSRALLLYIGTWTLAVLAVFWLAGCGGPTLSLDVEPKSLSIEAITGGSLPPVQTVKATFSGAAVLAGYPKDVQEPEWLDITNDWSATTGASFRFVTKTTSLPESTYTTTVRFVTGNEDGTDLKLVDLPVTYTVHPVPNSILPSKHSLSLSASRGQAPLPEL